MPLGLGDRLLWCLTCSSQRFSGGSIYRYIPVYAGDRMRMLWGDRVYALAVGEIVCSLGQVTEKRVRYAKGHNLVGSYAVVERLQAQPRA